ncbi:hypothetical protein BI347_09105 [Chromobacterium sphagni]|uniref:Molecular chaperone n=2 Tax=Chromobacterium sphagni TaxID=1903179 RepID=A0A1S1X659_9NEIS|nr:hypothetical protein BI347_09105 [Chromobacterium sphagni]OHX18196.1 hypothetical protein BI344_10825 [Chromobacterium sphagni]
MDPQLVDTQPASVAAWLERLPYTDLTECGRLLGQALYHLGRTPLDPMQRYKLLQLYLKALDRYYPLLEAEIQHNDILASPKTRLLAVLSVKLFANLFIAFKQTLNEKLSRQGLIDRDQPKIELLLYTMMAARQYLNSSQQNYCPLPDGFWLDCHQLYALALERGWQDKALANDDSLATIYRQILLLGLTSTNRLSLADMQLARQLIYDLARQVSLLPVAELPDNRHGYLLDPQEDNPPRYLLVTPGSLQSRCSLLELTGALSTMRRSLEQLQKSAAGAGAAPTNDETQLLGSLVEEWQHPRRRKHGRENTRTVVEVTTTVPSIWHRVNGNGWQLAGAGGEEENARLRPPPPSCLLVMVNQSESGYLLRGLPRDQTLRAGEVLLLQPPDQPGEIQLCSVRWVLMQPTGKEVECGVEILGRQPQPVLAMPSITHSGDNFQRGLLLPAAAGRPELLLLTGRQFSQLREFRLRDGEGERLIRAGKLLQQSPHFQLMEYRPSEYF